MVITYAENTVTLYSTCTVIVIIIMLTVYVPSFNKDRPLEKCISISGQ